MDEIEKIVRDKLERFGLGALEAVESRQLRQLLDIEAFIKHRIEIRDQSIRTYKENQITKKAIADSPDVKLTRKTIYNSELLNKYVEKSIEECDNMELIDSNRIKEIVSQNERIKEQYDKMVGDLIYKTNLENTVEVYHDEINSLKKKIDILNAEVQAKNKEIRRLQQLLYENGVNNVIPLNK